MAMTAFHRRYLARETAVSAAVNAALNGFVCWLVFGRGGATSIDDARAFATDFLPQAFILSLMSTLVPGAVTRRRMRTGEVQALEGPPSKLPRNLLLRALCIAGLAMLIGGGAALLLTLAVWQGPLSITQVYAIKVLFGVLLAVPVTLIGLRAALADRIS